MIKDRFSLINTILLDMDGVLWRGNDPIINIQDLFTGIVESNYFVCCITNNSTRSVNYYIEKLAQFGVDIGIDQVVTSAEASAEYLAEKYPDGGPVYVVGETGLLEALDAKGFCQIDNPLQNKVLAVVAGLDRKITYEKIDIAARLVSRGADFIGTNPDITFPVPEGFSPGAGVIINAIETASGNIAKVIGKPGKQLFNLALSKSGSVPEQAIMIGDRIETDIVGAQELGIRTGLVLSGVTNSEKASEWIPAPDLVAENALIILERLRNHEI